MAKLVKDRELIENAWEGGKNCFVVSLFTNKILCVNSNKIYDIPQARIESVMWEVLDKGIEKYTLELKVAVLCGIVVFGRSNEFHAFMKETGLEDNIKPISQLI